MLIVVLMLSYAKTFAADTSGRYIRDVCSANEDHQYDKGQCFGYALGTIEQFGRITRGIYCIPGDEFPMVAAIKTVDLISDNSDFAYLSASKIVLKALSHLYPCE